MCFKLCVVGVIFEWGGGLVRSLGVVSVVAQVKWKASPRKLAQVVLAGAGGAPRRDAGTRRRAGCVEMGHCRTVIYGSLCAAYKYLSLDIYLSESYYGTCLLLKLRF